MSLLLRSFHWLNETHLCYGGSSVLLKVYGFKCQLHLKKTLMMTNV
jgi:hypothetical protein